MTVDRRVQNPAVRRAYLVLIIGVAAVSLAAIFIRLAQAQAVPSILIAFGRLFVATLILTPAVLRNTAFHAQLRNLSRIDLLLLLTAGFFLAMHFISWVTSLEYTTVLISVVLVTTTPIWVALLEVIFLKARLSPWIIAGLALALVGGVVIGLSGDVTQDATTSERIDGAVLSVIGAMTVAVYLVIGRRLRSSLALTPYIWSVYGIAAVIVLAGVTITSTSITGHSAGGYLWVIATGLVPQLIGHSSLNYALAFLPATYVSISTQMEPILSAIAAVIVFAEIPGALQIVGGTFIITGVIVATVSQSRASRKPRQMQVNA